MNTVTEHTQTIHSQTQHGQPQAPPAADDRRARRPQSRPRVLTHPQGVMALVLRQTDTVNATKDGLTIALKGLINLTKQLAQAIQALQGRVKALEAPAGPGQKQV